jgi:hypothetical protein
MFVAEGCLADACGVVEVKRVASVAERGMTIGINGFDTRGERGRDCCCFGISHLSEAGNIRRFF